MSNGCVRDLKVNCTMWLQPSRYKEKFDGKPRERGTKAFQRETMGICVAFSCLYSKMSLHTLSYIAWPTPNMPQRQREQ